MNKEEKEIRKYEFRKTLEKNHIYQTPRQLFIRNYVSKNTVNTNMLLYWDTGVGKCHAKDTLILMYDGTFKKVQDIITGDSLMGDNSTPRNVMSISNGIDLMYDIINENTGKVHTVNKEHILCLKNANFDTIEISVKNYVELPLEYQKTLKGYSVFVDFEYKPLPNNCPVFTKESRIEHNLKTNAQSVRTIVLKNILEHFSKELLNGYLLKLAPNDPLYADTIFLAQSLGFGITVNEQGTLISHNSNYYTIYDISVKKKEMDAYYGFTLDSNNRYLLDDCTVTHNTAAAISIAEGFKEYLSDNGKNVIVLLKNENIKRNFTNEIKKGFSDKVEGYSFMTYGTFEKRVSNVSNSVLIIDEVHNITGNKRYDVLKKVLQRSYNYRIVLLTATPVFDSPMEIIQISNLLNQFEPENTIEDTDKLLEPVQINNLIFKNQVYKLTDVGKQTLEKLLIGKVSYNPISIDSNFPKVNIIGTESEGGILQLCKMSDYQTNIYADALNQETSLYNNSSFASTIVDGNNLQERSCKLYKLLENILLLNNQPGTIFVYSNFVAEAGTMLIKQILQDNGYYVYGNPRAEVQKTFVLYDSSYTPERRERLLKIYNSPENANGDIIKIIIGSPIMSEGITLKHTRHVHILEPSWNNSLIKQIIGRAARYKSHIDLPEEYRNVNVFKYCAIPSDNNVISIDLQKYMLSEYKERVNEETLALLRYISIDCWMNDNSESSKCLISKPNSYDKTTYKLYIEFYEKFDIEYVISIVRNLFKEFYIWSVEDIFERIPSTITQEAVFTALDHLVKNEIILSDPHSRDGVLILSGNLLIFNPLGVPVSSSIFAKALDFEVYSSRYTLEQFVKQPLVQKKEVKKKTISKISTETNLYNEHLENTYLVYGSYRDRGLNGQYGDIDGKFRIIDNRNQRDSQDRRKKNTGIKITSIKKQQLLDIINFLGINLGSSSRQSSSSSIADLASIIERFLIKNEMVLH